MWNISPVKDLSGMYLYIKIKAALLSPFNSSKRKKLREDFKYKFLGTKHEFHYDKNFDATKVPIYIVSYNRLSYLKQMIDQLEKYNLKNIHIIDNCSEYKPLLDYLKECPYTVHYMDKNYGHMVFWKSGKFDDVINNSLYVLTDPDIEFNSHLPENFMNDLYRLLGEHPLVSKVGFALKIDDLPEDNQLLKQYIDKWEKRFWKYPIKDKLKAYAASIDTTFALYRPGKHKNNFYTGIRVLGNFEARHLPWYHMFDNDDENNFYIKTSKNSSVSDMVNGKAFFIEK